MTADPHDVARTRQWLQRYARLLDARFRIPGTNFRFGLDPLIGLIPGAGDTVSLAMSGVVLWHAHRLGARRRTKLKMAGNLFVDWLVGSIPLVGDAFDAWFRANQRNVRLLERELDHVDARGAAPAGTGAAPSHPAIDAR